MKKGLSNFLKKQKQKNTSNKAEATVDPTANTSAETEQKVASNEPKEVAVEPVVEQAPEQKRAAAKQESSDEEEDDLELHAGVRYGNIAEKEEEAVTQADEEAKGSGAFTMEEKDEKPQEAPKKEKKTASNISFGGGKPRFGRGGNKAVTIDKNDGELADLLDEEPSSKKKAKKETAMLTRQAMAQKTEPAPVEEKKSSGPVKPTFRGKLNLRGAGADTTDSGVKTSYGFEVKYKPESKDEGEKAEVPRAAKTVFKQNRVGKDTQISIAEAEALENRTVDEDGFELVGAGNDRKARRQLGRPKDGDGDWPDEGFKIVRNEGKRGGAFAAMNG